MDYRWRNLIPDCWKWIYNWLYKRKKWRYIYLFYFICIKDKQFDLLSLNLFCFTHERDW